MLWARPDVASLSDPLLDAATRDRCAVFRYAVDAARHAGGRLLARRAAADVLGVAPSRVLVGTEPAGRPVLLDPDGSPWPLHLSITHAGELIGVALHVRPVGLDVQDVAAIAPVVGSDRIYTPAEIAVLSAAPPSDRSALAAQWWTAKEAVLKSVGRGLLELAERLDVRSSPAAVLLDGEERIVGWRPVAVAAGHMAALASADLD